jgi:uncharacterized protein YndB with AHSA1/START domain
MTKVQYETDIEAPVERVYEYYTNPDNIKEAWPRDIVKESEALTSSKNEEGSEMRVKGQYMGKEEEMRLEVSDKEQNSKLVTQQDSCKTRDRLRTSYEWKDCRCVYRG